MLKCYGRTFGHECGPQSVWRCRQSGPSIHATVSVAGVRVDRPAPVASLTHTDCSTVPTVSKVQTRCAGCSLTREDGRRTARNHVAGSHVDFFEAARSRRMSSHGHDMWCFSNLFLRSSALSFALADKPDKRFIGQTSSRCVLAVIQYYVHLTHHRRCSRLVSRIRRGQDLREHSRRRSTWDPMK